MAGITQATSGKYLLEQMLIVGMHLQRGREDLAIEIFNKNAAPFITDFQPYKGGNSFQLDAGGEIGMLVGLKDVIASKTLTVPQKLKEIEMIVNQKVRGAAATIAQAACARQPAAQPAPMVQNNQSEYRIPILPEWLLSAKKAVVAKATPQRPAPLRPILKPDAAPLERKEECKGSAVPAPLAMVRGVRLQPLLSIDTRIPGLSLDSGVDAAPDYYDDELYADARMQQKFAAIPAAPEFQRYNSEDDPDLLAALAASMQ